MIAIKAGQRGLGSSATTQLSMDIENKGGTFPRCRPVARIWSWSGGHWRVVTTTGFQDMRNDVGIIPGASVTLRTDLGKSLPAGKYKISVGIGGMDGFNELSKGFEVGAYRNRDRALR